MIFTDQLHNSINFKWPPARIVSLVPSQTELLFDLGLVNEVVGITKFCIYPKYAFEKVAKVGGTKTLNIDKIRDLKPDLIIGNKEENSKDQIELLRREFNVWMSDIIVLDDSINMILSVGDIVNKKHTSVEIARSIKQSFLNLTKLDKKVLYLIWKSPYMAAGNATFIGDMLNKIGLTNVIEDKSARYPILNIEEIVNLKPEVIFLSSEPYPFKENHVKELHKYLPNTKIKLVDGELFSWYGSRLIKSVSYFNTLIEEI